MVPGTKSAGESQALHGVDAGARQPGRDHQGRRELLTKYADTISRRAALLHEANAYQQKGDSDKAQIYAERVLEVNPKSFQAQLMLGELLASHTRENDLDKEEKLTKAEKYLKTAIDNVKTAPKPNPQITDAQWEEGKKFVIGGSAQRPRAGRAGAQEVRRGDQPSSRRAAETDPQPAYMVRLASAYESSGKNDEAIAVCDKVLADPQLHPQIKQVATNIKNAATAAAAKK